MKVPVVIAATALVLAGGGGTLWRSWRPGTAPVGDAALQAADLSGGLPVPPVPPRIAQGEEYERCLSMLPDDPAGALGLAEAWQASAGGEAAAHCAALAAVALGDVATGARALETLASSSTAAATARAQVFDQASQAWLAAGDAARAFAASTRAVALSPDDVDLLVSRAIAASALERFDAAREDLDRALDEDPRRLDAVILRGSAWRHLGRLDLARVDVDQGLAIDPDNTEALLERGVIREQGRDYEGARRDWERAVSLEPDSGTADLAQQNLALLDAGPERR